MTEGKEIEQMKYSIFEILSDLKQVVPNHLTDESQTR